MKIGQEKAAMTGPSAATAPNPALVELQPLIGRWTMRITWSERTHKLIGVPASIEAPARFEWSRDAGFLLHVTGGEGAPVANWVIGRDDTSNVFAVLYADGRGVSRIYQMSLARDVWKMWRDAPGFHQRFSGTISPDRRVIVARWEKSEDGMAWESDFDMTYTKID
jgi:hypothetical protein